MRTKLVGENGRSVARGLAVCRIRLGPKNPCGLVSRCGHQGLPITIATRAQPETGRAAPPTLKLALTERFGQDRCWFEPTINRKSLRRRFDNGNLSGKAKPMVAADRTPLHLVGDEDSSKRRQILDGARKVFMDLGFDGASMGEIARSAGVSKGTLYVYFADKSRLFEAIVEEESLEQGKVAFNFDPERDVVTTLREFGQAYIELLCRPGGGSAIRTVMAIAERMPEVGRRFYNNVVAHTIARLAAYLETRASLGDLAIEDYPLAATQFMQMCQASLFMPFVFQAAPAPSAERIAEVVESAMRMFLAGYQVKSA
jgi:AcrR family transcriptional regulator